MRANPFAPAAEKKQAASDVPFSPAIFLLLESALSHLRCPELIATIAALVGQEASLAELDDLGRMPAPHSKVELDRLADALGAALGRYDARVGSARALHAYLRSAGPAWLEYALEDGEGR